jgi:hypothetical protein
MTTQERQMLTEYAANCRATARDWITVADRQKDPSMKSFALSRAANNHAEAQRTEAQLCTKQPEPACQARD